MKLPFSRLAAAALCIASGLLALGADGASTPAVAVYVDESKLPDSSVAQIDQRTYISLRAVGEALSAYVSYSKAKHQVTVTTLLRQSVLRLDDPASGVRIVKGRIMIPLRILGDALGLRSSYDAKQHVVHVSTAALERPAGGVPTAPPISKANTIDGTVTEVDAQAEPPQVRLQAGGLYYTITIPAGTAIQFRDTRGATAGTGAIAQVKPGDALIVTMDAAGHLAAVADIFAGTSGTIAAISAQNLVLTNGKVVIADGSATTVELDGQPAHLADLRAGDLVTVRSNPRTGKVREIVALTPGGLTASAGTNAGSASGTAALKIDRIGDNAQSAMRAGQTLTVTADGTPGAQATFDLSNIFVDNPMRETNPGHYQGEFEVQVGANLIDAPILVRLRHGTQSAVAAGPDPLTLITQGPQVKDLAPAQGARVNTPRPSIYVTFVTLGGKGMQTDSLRLIVDGKDVSDQATRTAAFISFYPSGDLPAGVTSIEVKGADIAGNPVDYSWSFTIASQ